MRERRVVRLLADEFDIWTSRIRRGRLNWAKTARSCSRGGNMPVRPEEIFAPRPRKLFPRSRTCPADQAEREQRLRRQIANGRTPRSNAEVAGYNRANADSKDRAPHAGQPHVAPPHSACEKWC